MIFPNLEKVIKTTVIKDGDNYVPNLPCKSTYTLNIVDGQNFYGYPLPASTLGKPCLTYMVYDPKYDAKVKAFAGTIGKGNDVCKTADYKFFITQTVADIKLAEMQAQADKLVADAELKGEV